MPAYTDPLEPVALPGEAVRFEPKNEVREIRSMEQMGRIGPVDFGAATSGNDATESGSEIISLEDELEMNDNRLGQFLINPLSLVEVEVRQTGTQDQRFVNKNQVGVITPHSPLQQRLVWTFESQGIRAIITNRQTWDMAKTLVYFTGYKFRLSDPVPQERVDQMPGTPASIPTDTLKQPSAAGGP